MRDIKRITFALGVSLALVHADTAPAAIVIVPAPAGVVASSEYNATYAVTKMFDATVTAGDIGVTSYGVTDGQYAGSGVGPHNVFMDFGSSVTADGFVYSQRAGGVPSADKVVQIEFWFEATDPGTTLPAGPADATVAITNTVNSTLTQHSLGGAFSDQYVAMRMTGNSFNPGGSEFRLASGVPAPPPLTEAPLSNAAGGNPRSGSSASSPASVLSAGNTSTVGDDNGWVYDPDNPLVGPPEQSWAAGSGAPTQFLTQNNDAQNYWLADINLSGGLELRYLDVWGRDDYAGSAEQDRHQDLVITLYDGAGGTGTALFTSSPWSSVSTKPLSYGRFDFLAAGASTSALTQAASLRIDHSPGSGQYLLLAEVRAAGVLAAPIPEPASALLVLLGLGALGRYRSRRSLGT